MTLFNLGFMIFSTQTVVSFSNPNTNMEGINNNLSNPDFMETDDNNSYTDENFYTVMDKNNIEYSCFFRFLNAILKPKVDSKRTEEIGRGGSGRDLSGPCI